MKIDHSEVWVVVAGPMLYLYRGRTVIEELDSLKRPTGILHACGLCGLFKSVDQAAWIPGAFLFRKERAKLIQLPIDDDYLFPWLLAGVILGERTAKYRTTEVATFVHRGRLDDQAIAEKVWRDWLSWRMQGSPGTFARFTLGKSKLRFGEDERIHKIVQRLGLSVDT
jgi:hypothetical protein